MQQIDHWPDIKELALPKSVAQDLLHHLLEPFDSEQEAKQFWKETSSTLIILNNFDVVKEQSIRDQIEFVMFYTEYTLPLSLDYRLQVAIMNDSGGGIHCVIPPDC